MNDNNKMKKKNNKRRNGLLNPFWRAFLPFNKKWPTFWSWRENQRSAVLNLMWRRQRKNRKSKYSRVRTMPRSPVVKWRPRSVAKSAYYRLVRLMKIRRLPSWGSGSICPSKRNHKVNQETRFAQPLPERYWKFLLTTAGSPCSSPLRAFH